MAARTIRAGLVTYRPAGSDPGVWVYGLLGDEVDVHGDDIERFDRLNPAETAAEPEEEPAEPAFPEGDPDEKWTVKQLDAYAAENSIDVSSASNKAEKLELITAGNKSGE